MNKYQQLLEDILASCFSNDISSDEFKAVIEWVSVGVERDLRFEEQEEKDRKETERSLLWK